jgi:hypothetical protein
MANQKNAPTEPALAVRKAKNAALLLQASLHTAVFAIIVTLILGGPALFVVEMVFHTNFSTAMLLATLVSLFLMTLVLGAFFYRSLWRKIGGTIQIYPDRLVYVRKGESIDFRWEDLSEFYCQAVDVYHSTMGVDRRYKGSKAHYRFIHRDGRWFEFYEPYYHGKLVPIESLVAGGLLNRQLPILRERFLKGYETIDFGPLRLEPEGVGKGSSLLRWEDVDFVGMEDGAVFVRKKDKMLNWCSVKAEKVKNFCLLLALAKERCAQTWAPSPQVLPTAEHPATIAHEHSVSSSPDLARFRPVEGPAFAESRLLVAAQVLLGVFVLGPIGVFLLLAWWNGWSLANQQVSTKGAVVGAVLLCVGFCMALLVAKLFRRENFIIGRECLQVVVGAEKVTQQIPYRNIAKIKLLRGPDAGAGSAFIGILLANTGDATTLCPTAEATMKQHGWHCRITASLRSVPLEQLYDLILKQMPSTHRPEA